MNPPRPRRPATRADFEIAIICALLIEADAVVALFDHCWDDDGPVYDKAAGDLNAYSIGAIGRHNVVPPWSSATRVSLLKCTSQTLTGALSYCRGSLSRRER